MRTPLAWLNLTHSKTRTLLAVAGVAFAVLLIFMQLGFLGSARESAGLVFEALDFDVLVRAPRYIDLLKPRSFPRACIYRAAAVEGVADVQPFHLSVNFWRNPITGRKRLILLLGVEPGAPVFRFAEMQRKSRLLGSPEFVLVDRRSRPEFGPQRGQRFSDADVGVLTDVGEKRVKIVGHFQMGTGFAADGAIMLSDRGLCRVTPGRNRDQVTLGLVKLDPDAELQATLAALKDALGEDVEVLTRGEVYRTEADHWVYDMPIGIIFQLGVAVAMVVGVAIVYQILATDVANHLPEYATLKVIGYGDRFLSRVVLEQAVILAVLGFVPGWIAAQALYTFTAQHANIPMTLPPGRVAFVLGLSLAMCIVSGLAALRKLRTADPADLF